MRVHIYVLLSFCLGCPCEMELIGEGLPAALFSVQGTAAEDVWVVGATDGTGPVWAHWDGDGWTTVETAAWSSVDLWWVWPGAEEVVAVGSAGTVLSLDRATGEVTEAMGLRADATYFGVWGSGPDDLYLVGGNVAAGGSLPAIHHREGGVWTDVETGTADAPGTWFKVHGTGQDDVWIVGTLGARRWDGVSWADTGVPADIEGLLTVHTGGPWPVAVGGSNQGRAIAFQDGAWRDVSPPFAPAINGVCASGETMVAVGAQGAIYRWDGAAFAADADNLSFEDFHGCWVDGEREIWAVGGHISAAPLNNGIIGHEGKCGIASF